MAFEKTVCSRLGFIVHPHMFQYSLVTSNYLTIVIQYSGSNNSHASRHWKSHNPIKKDTPTKVYAIGAKLFYQRCP